MMKWYGRLLTLTALFLAVTMASGTEQVQAAASDRALQFVLNLYTGIPMKAQDWLTIESQTSPGLATHGGLAAMVRQSTAYAHQYGGVSSIQIETLRVIGETQHIAIRVQFRGDDQRKQSPVAGEREDIVWRLAARKQRRAWLLTVE